jgi:hypothetical protein
LRQDVTVCLTQTRSDGHDALVIIRGTRRWTPTALVVAVVAALAAAVLAAPAQAATPPSVQGVVTAADGSGPIAGIEVCAVRLNSGGDLNDRTCTHTATDGSYAIQLSKAKFRFEAEEPYLYGSWVRQAYQAGKSFTVSSTTSLTANFALVRGATISGHVTPPEGGPTTRYLHVNAFRVDSAGKTASSSSYISNLGSDGYFNIAKLPAGTYKLLVDDGNSPEGYNNQWYPAASAAGAAEPITVGTGQTQGGLEILLTPTGSITLSLFNPDGTPSSSDPELYDADGRQVVARVSGYPSTVTFNGLHPGAYKIRASPISINIGGYHEWFGGASTFAKATVINVVSSETVERTMTFHYKTLKATKRPTVKYRTHSSITALNGTWSPAKPASYLYDWYRDGKIVVSGTSDWVYSPKRADIGHKITVCVTADRSGYAAGRSCSSNSAKIKEL